MNRFGLHSKRVLLNHELVEATIVIYNDKIEVINLGPISSSEYKIENFGDYVIMPGIIDSHVHINDPGRADWEGFDTATKSAAAGGVTTLVDMPLNSTPVTIDKNSLNRKLDAAKNKCHVNCGFWGGLIPGSYNDLQGLIDAGVMGIKVFLTHSGIDDFPNVSESDLIQAAQILKRNDTLLLAHCELAESHKGEHVLKENPESYQAYLQSRPKSWEDEAIKLMIGYCEDYDIRTHIVHLASCNSISLIRNAKERGLRLTAETCPHYLYFDAEEIPDRSTIHKCAPPIREKKNNEELWAALEEGLLDFVVTDHSPAPPILKALDTGRFDIAWGGIAGLQFSLPTMWTLAEKRGMTISDLSQRMSKNIAKFLGLDKVKGRIQKGYDADLVIWDSKSYFEVKEEEIEHKHKITPYLGCKLKGRVIQTYVNGKLVFDQGQFVHLNSGKLLLKHR